MWRSTASGLVEKKIARPGIHAICTRSAPPAAAQSTESHAQFSPDTSHLTCMPRARRARGVQLEYRDHHRRAALARSSSSRRRCSCGSTAERAVSFDSSLPSDVLTFKNALTAGDLSQRKPPSELSSQGKHRLKMCAPPSRPSPAPQELQ